MTKVQTYQKLNKRLENIRTIKDAYQELISYIKGNVKRKKDAIIGRGGVEYHIFFEQGY